MRFLAALLLLVTHNSFINGDDTTGTSVARHLVKCYLKPEYLDPNRRPPATINILIDLIRKVENGKSAVDARQITNALLFM